MIFILEIRIKFANFVIKKKTKISHYFSFPFLHLHTWLSLTLIKHSNTTILLYSIFTPNKYPNIPNLSPSFSISNVFPSAKSFLSPPSHSFPPFTIITQVVGALSAHQRKENCLSSGKLEISSVARYIYALVYRKASLAGTKWWLQA